MGALIIYDFDGVIADSEVLANTVLAEIVTELGVPTTLEDSYRLYMGKRFVDVIAAVESSVGRPLPSSFASDYQARTLERFRRDLRFVDGARDYIDAFAHLPRCIASSSSPDRLALCLEVLDLRAAFSTHVFSASAVPRGKPDPDIFFHAAKQMGRAPADCIVIEDSVSGVTTSTRSARRAWIRWLTIRHASTVFPKPTSSASSQRTGSARVALRATWS